MIAVDPNNPKGIVWIASYPKSGNTWLRVFLHHVARIGAGRPASEHELDMLGKTSSAEAGRIDLYEAELGKPISTATFTEIARVRPDVQRAIAEEAESIIPTKTHSMLGEYFGTPMINSAISAGAIYLVRNPLDVAISLSAHVGAPLDETIGYMERGDNVSNNYGVNAPEIWGSWSQNVASWCANALPVILILRYEDLLQDPLRGFTSVIDHMRLDVAPETIEEAVRLSSFDVLQEQERRGGFGERIGDREPFFREGRAGQWRERLSPEQVDRIVFAHRGQMHRFGYLPVH